MDRHYDTLEDWWEKAEKTGPVHEGDTLIEKYGDEYKIFPAFEFSYGLDDDMRILERAPKPKWYSAVAVVARVLGDDPGLSTGAFIKTDTGGWMDDSGNQYVSGELIDAVPLIPAEVTDEMVLRYCNFSWGSDEKDLKEFESVEVFVARRALSKALGVEK